MVYPGQAVHQNSSNISILYQTTSAASQTQDTSQTAHRTSNKLALNNLNNSVHSRPGSSQMTEP
eukprot:UN03852